MVYAIFLIYSLLGIAAMTAAWLKGEDVKTEAKGFPTFLGLTILEGLLLVTTLIPPSAGLFAGCLFGYWIFTHILAARGVLQEKTIRCSKLGWGALKEGIFVGLVTISYFGG